MVKMEKKRVVKNHQREYKKNNELEILRTTTDAQSKEDSSWVYILCYLLVSRKKSLN